MIINIYNSTVLNDAVDKVWANTAVIQGLGKGFGMLVFFTKSSFVKFQPKAFYHFYGFPEATVCRYSSK